MLSPIWGFRPHRCSTCSARFSTAEALARHSVEHGLPSPVPCPVCLQSFPGKDALKRHKTSKHRNLRQYGCAFKSCSRKFATIAGLDAHVKTQHKTQITGKRFSCTLCGIRFAVSAERDAHERDHEND